MLMMFFSSLPLEPHGEIHWQVRRSPQAKQFFKKYCKEALNEVLELLPYSKTHWGSWNGVIRHLLILEKVCSLHIIPVQNLTKALALCHVRLSLNS
jgi:hypothetical protein